MVENVLQRERLARREVRRVLELVSQRPDGMREQMSLQLKTKTFDGRASSAFETFTDDMVDNDGNVRKQHDFGSVDDCPNHQTDCSICMMEIQHGERIGDLACGHHFHVDCLKTWVLWRNTCPLCNAEDIAETKVTLVPRDR